MISIALCNAQSGYMTLKDTGYSTKTITDSINILSRDTVLDLNPTSKKFILFKRLNNTATSKELYELIKYNPGAVVKGYSYIVLKLRNDPKADFLIKAYFIKLNVQVADEIGAGYTANFFISDIKDKLFRIKAIINNSKSDFPSNNERRTNRDENKVRKEQGVPQLQDH